MFDFLFEKLAERKNQILNKINNLEFSEKIAKDWWINKEIKEGERIVIAGCDGSYNYKEFKSFTIYAVNSEVLIFDKKLNSIKACDIDILYPYRYTEERLRFYMHMFETKNIFNALKNNKIDLLLFDGSIIGDIIRPLPFQLNPDAIVKEQIKNNFLNKLKSEDVEIVSKNYFKEIEKSFPNNKIEAQSYLEYLEHLLSLHNMLSFKEKIVAISKTSTSTYYFDKSMPDMAIFEKLSKSQGYSKPIYLTINEKLKREFPILNDFFKDLEFTIFYARLKDRKNLLKFEIPKRIKENELENLLSKIKTISVDGYPYLLKKAHSDVVIHDVDMEKIARIFGFTEKTGREML
ncbi:MAG: DNA double-strand break repair nuclease NurA [Candidatus Aenigmatarchaeota archaeon]